MISIRRWAPAAGVTVLAAFFLFACGGQEEPPEGAATQPGMENARTAPPPPKPQPTVTPGEAGDEVRYSGETASGETYAAQLGGDVELPANFPEDLPLYPNSVPFAAMETGGGTAIVALDANAKAPEVYEYYKQNLPSSGWIIENEMNIGAARMLTTVKGDRKAVLQIESTEKGARVSVSVAPAG
jgi:hypothetical protein